MGEDRTGQTPALQENLFSVLGPPGTGKTRYLERQIARAVEKHGSEAVLAASFTRAAAATLASRVRMPKEQLGTLHSLCYRWLGHPGLVETPEGLAEWNEAFPGEDRRLLGAAVTTAEVGPALEVPTHKSEGGRLHEMYGLLRAKMVPRDRWPTAVLSFAKDWETFKDASGMMDFADLIEVALREGVAPPPAIRVGFFDEVQDFTRLEISLVRQWSRGFESVVMAGDDDQCHPPGTMIRTPSGPRPIEDLRDGDAVTEYNRDGSYFTGGASARVGTRLYSGRLLAFTANGRQVEVTPEHRMLVKERKDCPPGTYVVYLMRSGDRYRVGLSKWGYGKGANRLRLRARQEQADAVWVLDVTTGKIPACVLEDTLSYRYGIPQTTFTTNRASVHYQQGQIDAIFDAIPDLPERASAMLRALGLDPNEPTYDGRPKIGQRIYETSAANIHPDLHLLPSDDGPGTSWHPFTIAERHYSGPVYSLETPKHHLYCANGVVVHNCIYTFKGAHARALVEGVPPGNIRVLGQSYRVPSSVHGVAERWVQQVAGREEKTYKPREEEGEVRFEPALFVKMPGAVLRLLGELPGSTMILASTGYHLGRLLHELKSEGVPFHNPYRVAERRWNPLLRAERGVSTIDRYRAFAVPASRGELWTYKQLGLWVELVNANAVLRRGAKAEILAEAERHDAPVEVAPVERLLGWFYEEDLDRALRGEFYWLMQVAVSRHKQGLLPYLHEIALRQGGPLVADPKPQVIVGTIHSVKGGEADNVVLFGDLSPQGYRSLLSRGELRDSVLRTFYVGMTRARERLVLAGSSGPGVSWLR